MNEIEKNGYNLNISRYANTAVTERSVDLERVNNELIDIEKKIKEATDRHNKYLRELGLLPIV